MSAAWTGDYADDHDDLADFVPADQRGRSMTAGYLDDWDRDRSSADRRYTTRLLADMPKGGEPCSAVVEALAAERGRDGRLIGQMGRLVSLLRLAEQGHTGAHDAAIDHAQTWRHRTVRDAERVIEYALSYIARDGSTPDHEKGCCPPVIDLDARRAMRVTDEDRAAAKARSTASPTSRIKEACDPTDRTDRQRTRSSTDSDESQVDDDEDDDEDNGKDSDESQVDDDEDDDEDNGKESFAEWRERKVKEREAYLDIEEEARRRHARRKRADRPSLEDELIDSCDLAHVPPPEWLIEGLIPKAAVGFLSGKYGSYKSFLSVSLACYLAAGKSWQGRDEFAVREPGRVLYVAAEGASGVAQRVEAWKRAHGPLDRGRLVVYPKPIKLNDPFDVEELAALCRKHRFALTIVDTFHRSAPGVEENSSTEFGLVFEAVADIRDEIGMTTLFDDHTGHGGTRTRGTSAKEDDADFSLLLDLPGDDRGSDVQRTLTVRKFKDAPSEGEWPVRLVNVPDVGPRGSAYLELGEVGARDGSEEIFGLRDWWKGEFVFPEEVTDLSGQGSDVALDIFRVLRHVNAPGGLTKTEIAGALAEGPRKAGKTARYAAFALLERKGIVGPGETGSRIALTSKFRPTE